MLMQNRLINRGARCLFSLSLLAAFFLTNQILADAPSKEMAKLLEKTLQTTYEGNSYTLLHHPNHSGNLYVKVGTNNYVCEIKSGPLFPLPDELPDVQITKVKQGSDTEIVSRKPTSERKAGGGVAYDTISIITYQWVFSLKHRHLGRGELYITKENGELPDNTDEVAEVLARVFKGDKLSTPVRFAGNKSSKTLHYAVCGHLPDDSKVEPFADPAKAHTAGYRDCPLCFNKLIYLSHLHTEEAIGKESESALRHYYQIDPSLDLQKRVAEAGQRVLAHWPIRLKGYSYRFQVVDDEDFSATSCATGYIFVKRGLMKTIESEDELEAVLAHEIAHVELRHGLMEYLKAQRDVQNAAIFTAIVSAGMAAGAAANNADALLVTSAVGSVSVLLAQVAAHISLIGYNKEHQLHADVFTLIYLQNQGKSRETLTAVLHKLRSNQEIDESIAGVELGDSAYATLKERLFISQSLEVRPSPQREIYDAYDKNGDLLYSFALDAQAIYKKRDGKFVHMLLGELHATPAIGEPKTFESVKIVTGGKPNNFKTDGKTSLMPLDTLAISLTRTVSNAEFFADELSVSIEGISAARIEKRTEKPSN